MRTVRAWTIALLTVALCAACGGRAAAQEKQGKGLRLSDLPASVQKTVRETLNGGEIENINKEKEDGIEQYEIESVLNGKARGFNVDLQGTLLVLEEATTIDAIPAAAKTGILKRVGAGTLTTVETFAKPGRPLMYEVGYSDAKGKKHEVLFTADGTEVKE